jgi:hypothetical protein
MKHGLCWRMARKSGQIPGRRLERPIDPCVCPTLFVPSVIGLYAYAPNCRRHYSTTITYGVSLYR